MEQKPSVGRIVHFFEDVGSEPQAAIITEVFSDDCVNLTIFPSVQPPIVDKTSISKKTEFQKSYCWDWPARV